MKYLVSMAVDGRVSVEVEADSVGEAFEKAKYESFDLSEMDVIDAKPVNCSDEDGNLLEDYNG